MAASLQVHNATHLAEPHGLGRFIKFPSLAQYWGPSTASGVLTRCGSTGIMIWHAWVAWALLVLLLWCVLAHFLLPRVPRKTGLVGWGGGSKVSCKVSSKGFSRLGPPPKSAVRIIA